MNDLSAGRFSILDFYHRRIRRIFPALFVVVSISTVIAAVLLMPREHEEFGQSFLATNFFVSNIYFWRTTDYFAGPAEWKPLLHMWSLSVEEQFYVGFPILLWALYRWQKERISAWLLFLLAGSVIACVLATNLRPTGAFFLAPFRAWELLLGALLAINAIPPPTGARAAHFESFVGAALIAWPVAAYSSETAFPGWAALAPCLGAALLIHSGGSTFVGRMLSLRPVAFIGLISYSLYLWHWPLLSFSRYYLPDNLSWSAISGILVASIVLASVSWRFVEQPVRHRVILSTRKQVFASFIVGTTALSILGAGVVVSGGWPQRFSPQVQRYAAMYDLTKYLGIYDRGGCFIDLKKRQSHYDIKKCLGIDSPSSEGDVLLFGDSFAANLYPGLQAIGVDVHQYTATSCRPMEMENHECSSFYNSFFTKILPVTHARTIIVAGLWANIEKRYGRETLNRRIAVTLDRISAAGRRVILYGQSPIFKKPVPYLLARQAAASENRLIRENTNGINSSLAELARKHNVTFFNPYDAACTEDSCIVAENGQPFHWDFGHMTLSGSKFYAQHLMPLLSQPVRAAGNPLNHV